MRNLWIVTAMTGLMLGTASASAGVFGPPPGKVFWGGQGGYTAGPIRDFARQSGKHPAAYHFYVQWGATGFISGLLDISRRQRTRPVLNISTKMTRQTPRSLAQGRGDDFLIGLNRLLDDYRLPVYVEPLAEMNNGNNPYAPYDLSGRSRGAEYSTAAFRGMWKRTALILRGGNVAAIDRKLRRLGLPPARTSRATLAQPRVGLVWTPLSFGNPEIEKNHPRHFWPGSAYVDWVATTWYSPFRTSSAFHRFYSYPAWRDKPFAFTEFAVWGPESPGFIDQFFGFVRSHPRVRMALYYQSAAMRREFRLSTHPRSRAALRRHVRSSRFAALAPEFEAQPGTPVKPPTQGETANVHPRGSVVVRTPGAKRRIRLRSPRQLPVGTVVDTTRGRIELATAVDQSGAQSQSALVYGGRFVIRQPRRQAETRLVLRGPIGRCRATTSKRKHKSKRKSKRRRERRLWVKTKGPGKFVTNGKYGSGSARGTQWLTRDRCDGTLVRVTRGVVAVRDFGRGTTVDVAAGERYLARRR
jgi:hypothetical protein